MPEESPPNLSHYDAVLIDLDGTLYREEAIGAQVLPGAVELIHRLHKTGQKYACLTNSGLSPKQLAVRLAQMGAPVDEPHIWSCAAAAAQHVHQTFGPAPRVFNAATDGIDELLAGRARWVSSEDEPCDVVMAASPVNPQASQARQWQALQLLRKGAALVGLCADRVYPSHRGLEFGSGSMTAMLAYAANVTPTFCGKPEEFFFRELCARLGTAPEKCILIGDNLDSDVAGARRVGMTSTLVLTGVATRADAGTASHDRRPDFIIETLADL